MVRVTGEGRPMRDRVALETQGRVETSDIAEALRAGGAENVRVDARSGDSGAGVSQYYFFEFDDGLAGGRHRVGFAFHAMVSSESARGWTRFELGADDRARCLVEGIAERVGGWLVDDRFGSSRVYDAPAPAYAPVPMAA